MAKVGKTGKRGKRDVIITTTVIVAVIVVGVYVANRWGWEIPDRVTVALGVTADAFVKARRKAAEFFRTHPRLPP